MSTVCAIYIFVIGIIVGCWAKKRSLLSNSKEIYTIDGKFKVITSDIYHKLYDQIWNIGPNDCPDCFAPVAFFPESSTYLCECGNYGMGQKKEKKKLYAFRLTGKEGIITFSINKKWESPLFHERIPDYDIEYPETPRQT